MQTDLSGRPFMNRRKPIATYVSIGVLVLLFIVDFASKNILRSSYGLLSIYGMKINSLIRTGEVWRLFTANLLHSGFQHILMNCLGLYIWGRIIESFYGRTRFMLIMLFSGLSCVAASFAFSSYASLGASGMVFGLYGAIAGIYKFDKKLFNAVFGVQLLVFIAVSVVLGFLGGAVDNFGHIGGLIGGFFISRALGLLMEKRSVGKFIFWVFIYAVLLCALLYIGYAGYFNI